VLERALANAQLTLGAASRSSRARVIAGSASRINLVDVVGVAIHATPHDCENPLAKQAKSGRGAILRTRQRGRGQRNRLDRQRHDSNGLQTGVSGQCHVTETPSHLHSPDQCGHGVTHSLKQ
jgi:hypothetical protein